MKNKGIALLPVLLIAAVAISVAAYFVFSGKVQFTPETAVDRSIRQIQVQGTSDEVEAIETDVNATSFSEIDTEVSSIEAELDAGLSQ